MRPKQCVPTVGLAPGLRGLAVLAFALLVVGSARTEDAYVGSDTCEGCHEEVVTAFEASAHWKANPQESCEGCHGPGTRHAEEADPALILRFGDETPPVELNAPCLECHGIREPLAGFDKSDHGLADVACVSCHSPHRPSTHRELLNGTPDRCYDCHSGVRARFSLAETHAASHSGVQCRDCHDPHTRSQRTVLGGFKQQTCLRCHTEYRGPWFFEHEAVAVEGCTACHTPHGSVNRHLLTYQRAGDLCLQCHPAQPFTHVLNGPDGPRTTRYNRCTDCHTEVHGSNNDALFLN